MTLAETVLPFGLREVKLYPHDLSTGAIQDGIALPASRTFSFSEAEDFEELRGDDGVVAIRGKGSKVEWELEAGGISFDAWKVMAGGTNTVDGVTPTQVKSFKKKTTDVRPYFSVRGRALSDSGGDFHGLLFKCRASDNLEGELSDGSWWLSSASGEAIGDDNSDLYEFRQQETATPVPTTWD